MDERVLDSARTFVGGARCGAVRAARVVSDALELAAAQERAAGLLRDLDRPVIKFEVNITEFERVEIPRDAGRDAYAEVKQTFRMDRRVPMESLVQTNRWALEAMREVKATLAKPWADAPKFGRVYMSASEALLSRF